MKPCYLCNAKSIVIRSDVPLCGPCAESTDEQTQPMRVADKATDRVVTVPPLWRGDYVPPWDRTRR